jgi:2-polyprenyl-3-methyl-5-hydroxy-6-metoxy-1,4-benzoquinol methylase
MRLSIDTHVGHLRYGVYKRVQDFIHVGYAHQRAILESAWSTHGKASVAPGSTRVLELACGGGSLAEAFAPEEYVGVDASLERITAARRDHPRHQFEARDVTSPNLDDAIACAEFVFCHGLLHHISDAECQELIARVDRLVRKPATFIAIEPLLPRAWRNPLGYVVAKLDEGRHFRSSAAYRALFGVRPVTTTRFSLLPRLPLEMESFTTRLV